MPGRTVHADSLFLPEIYSGEKRQQRFVWTLGGEPRGAPVGRVLSYSCADLGPYESPSGDAQSERDRSSCGRISEPVVVPRSAPDTMLHALGYRDALVALLLVVVARPVDSVESTYFIVSHNLHFGSIRSVLCPRPLAEPASEPRFLAGYGKIVRFLTNIARAPPLLQQGNELHTRHTITSTPLS